MLHAFLYGIILAFGLIIPLGIQNIFVFNQGASQQKLLHALPSVITAASCDTLLIIMAVLGVSVIVLTIPWLKLLIFIVGFFFLAYMGFVIWKSQPKNLDKNHQPLSAKRQIGFAMSVSLLNPHAFLDTIGVIGTNALEFTGTARLAYTLACILTSCIWFTSLAIAGRYLQQLDKSGLGLKIINKVSALIIWIVAIYLARQVIHLTI